MRMFAVIVIGIFTLLTVGCNEEGVRLQPPQQGEWSNFHNDKDAVTRDARPEAAKPPEK
jgi:hypothetical protein